MSETPAGVEPASVGLQPTTWPSGPGVFVIGPEPAVGLEPTWSALRGRCPACRASPAFFSSQCWCRTSSTEGQRLGPLPRAWLMEIQSQRRDSNPHAPLYRRGARPVELHWLLSGVGSRLRSGTTTVTGSHAEPLHHTHHGAGFTGQYPREESNLTFDLRTVACHRHTPRTFIKPVAPVGVEPTAPVSANGREELTTEAQRHREENTENSTGEERSGVCPDRLSGIGSLASFFNGFCSLLGVFLSVSLCLCG
jgi:hypothetical protein